MDDARAAQILQSWFSPAYPIGAFAYSHGLEQAIAEGSVASPEAFTEWAGLVLSQGTGRNDAILLHLAAREGADLAHLSALAEALAPGRERHLEASEQGAALARITSEAYGTAPDPAPLPVAVGAAATALGLPTSRVAAHYLHAFAANLVSAAIRFMPMGQAAGQKALAALFPVIERISAEAETATEDDLGSAALGADIASIAHETLATRIFRT